MSDEKKQDKAKTAYQKWYAKNKAKFNEKRRKRYSKDKDYRDKAVEEAKKYRTDGTENPMSAGIVRLDAEGNEYTVYRIGAVSKAINKSVYSILKWEEDGLIPETKEEGGQRVYTAKQIELMKSLGAMADLYSQDKIKMDKAQKHFSVLIKADWEN